MDRFGQAVFDDHKTFVQNWLRLTTVRDELSKKVASGEQGDTINNEAIGWTGVEHHLTMALKVGIFMFLCMYTQRTPIYTVFA